MTVARSQIIHPSVSLYYHCIARCVRQSFLCGEDRSTGRNYDHRKVWLVERMKLLESIFAVRIAAYAVMSNHYHLVLYWDIEQGQAWSDREVVARWCRLYRNPLGLSYLAGETLQVQESEQLRSLIKIWRKRLMDISWYMRCLNEYIARRANREDECKGHFWEARFRSQALLDDAAVLSCMAYVDLNPIRAGLCERLEDADFTSIQERIRRLQEVNGNCRESAAPLGLMSFSDEDPNTQTQALGSAVLPCNLSDYLALVDWTGRHLREDKRGSIPKHVPRLLAQLGMEEEESWMTQVKRYRTSRVLKMTSIGVYKST